MIAAQAVLVTFVDGPCAVVALTLYYSRQPSMQAAELRRSGYSNPADLAGIRLAHIVFMRASLLSHRDLWGSDVARL